MYCAIFQSLSARLGTRNSRHACGTTVPTNTTPRSVTAPATACGFYDQRLAGVGYS